MRTDAQAGWAGALRWRRPRLGLPRPSGIRNGGLLLVLVALAAVMALVDRPPEVPDGPCPGVIQHLPPPAGITGLPPAVAQPAAPAGSGGVAALAGSGERPGSLDRAHPNRQHPRPGGAGSVRVRSGEAAGRRPAGRCAAGGGPGAAGAGTLGRRPRDAAGAAGSRPAGGPGGEPALTVHTPARSVPRLRLG